MTPETTTPRREPEPPHPRPAPPRPVRRVRLIDAVLSGALPLGGKATAASPR
jgi:hypothetical protein